LEGPECHALLRATRFIVDVASCPEVIEWVELNSGYGTAELEAATDAARRNPVQIAAQLIKNRSTGSPKLTSATIPRRRGSRT